MLRGSGDLWRGGAISMGDREPSLFVKECQASGLLVRAAVDCARIRSLVSVGRVDSRKRSSNTYCA
ncbi:hypothetical protein BN2475_640043 [Paraburkholderia ribeironis]|uniref:Uncharacterized protein n=1 Tax=Paraburkholderia ribeironis TaxID=1247936 RepID=A0A1N7SG70_9BURK|nr:hypothetical protein BN2475_640043 [Paraburkholderia ribeironis]